MKIKKIYIIPGYFESESNYNYLKSKLTYMNWEVVIVPVKWKYKKVNDWVDQVESFFLKEDLNNATVLGFSAGALILMLIAKNSSRFNHIVICSLPHTLGSSIDNDTEKNISFLGSRRINEIKRINIFEVLKHINTCKIDFVFGENESSNLKKFSKGVHNAKEGSNLIVLDNAGHDLNSKEYTDGIITKVLE